MLSIIKSTFKTGEIFTIIRNKDFKFMRFSFFDSFPVYPVKQEFVFPVVFKKSPFLVDVPAVFRNA